MSGPAAPVSTALDAAVTWPATCCSPAWRTWAPGSGPNSPASGATSASAGLRWPLLAVEDLAEQIEAYAARSAVHRPEQVADLLAELAARRRAAAWADGSPRVRILGTEEAAQTPLRLIRLTGLGCRVEAFGQERRVRVFLAESSSGVVLTLHHRWPAEDAPADGPALGGRRLAGSTVRELAAGAVVTESARRGADRRIRLAAGRVGRTTVSPGSGTWDALPQRLLLRDLAAAAAEFERLPPRLIRPRVEAEDVRVVEVGGVEDIRYLPGAQRLEAKVTGAGGGTVTVAAEYRGVLPAPSTRWPGPWTRSRASSAERCGAAGAGWRCPARGRDTDAVVVPDLAPRTGSGWPAPGWPEDVRRDGAALESARRLLAEVAHRGARHLPPSFGERLHASAGTLDRAGLGRCAADLRGVARALGPAPESEAFQAWTAATVRIVTTSR